MNPGRNRGRGGRHLWDDISLTLQPGLLSKLCLNILSDKELTTAQSHSIPESISGFS